MWIKLYGGQLKPNIKYRVIPQEEFDALKASRDKLVERIKALEELLTCYRIGRNPTETLHRKLDETKQARKEAEAIK